MLLHLTLPSVKLFMRALEIVQCSDLPVVARSYTDLRFEPYVELLIHN